MRHSSALLVLLASCGPTPGTPSAPSPSPAASASAPSPLPSPLPPPPRPPPPSPSASPRTPDPAPVTEPGPVPEATAPPELPTTLDARPGSARACRHARADLMAKTCTRDEQCAVRAIAKACPNVPMTFVCERGHCRSRRTDGCDPPYELDADAMRRTIVDCVLP